ncbi:hypothetical protein [Streptobacillus moniliformis]|uniref:hypothetical protein n=1 Tax=Streptobacillus moniliformis TaxID=34105 RepID=UPI0007E31DF5|nr:hypothetical protein [Streptobacillus moniliformis]
MKRILILMMIFTGIILFPNEKKITGPRYRLEGSVGVFSSNKALNRDRKTFSSITIGLLPEWKVDLDKRFDITFGPKIGANVSYYKTTNAYIVEPKGILSIVTYINYRLKEDIKLYSGIELGIALGGKINDAEKKLVIETIQNVLLGIKIKERYNVGIYMGNGKGMLGIEAGYTF